MKAKKTMQTKATHKVRTVLNSQSNWPRAEKPNENKKPKEKRKNYQERNIFVTV